MKYFKSFSVWEREKTTERGKKKEKAMGNGKTQRKKRHHIIKHKRVEHIPLAALYGWFQFQIDPNITWSQPRTCGVELELKKD